MYQRLPKTDETTRQVLDRNTDPDSSTTLNFRALRSELESNGWWERDVGHELRLLSIWGTCFLSAAYFAHSELAGAGYLSAFLLSLFFTQSGWLGHDYVHGKDQWCDRLRQLTTACAGLGVTWWSDKHNKHHALTNEIGVDEDIATDPFLYTWAPDPEHDSPLRKVRGKDGGKDGAKRQLVLYSNLSCSSRFSTLYSTFLSPPSLRSGGSIP